MTSTTSKVGHVGLFWSKGKGPPPADVRAARHFDFCYFSSKGKRELLQTASEASMHRLMQDCAVLTMNVRYVARPNRTLEMVRGATSTTRQSTAPSTTLSSSTTRATSPCRRAHLAQCSSRNQVHSSKTWKPSRNGRIVFRRWHSQQYSSSVVQIRYSNERHAMRLQVFIVFFYLCTWAAIVAIGSHRDSTAFSLPDLESPCGLVFASGRAFLQTIHELQ